MTRQGDVGVVRMARGDVRAIYGADGWLLCDTKDVRGATHKARPLVVIDPEDREQVEHFRDETMRSLRNHLGNPAVDDAAFTEGDLANAMQAALRTLLAPPRPDEPQGLLASVEDEQGRIWARDSEGWVLMSSPNGELSNLRNRWEWADIAVTKILSEGVR